VSLVQFLLVAQLHSFQANRRGIKWEYIPPIYLWAKGVARGEDQRDKGNLTNVGQLICFNSIIALIFYRIKGAGRDEQRSSVWDALSKRFGSLKNLAVNLW